MTSELYRGRSKTSRLQFEGEMVSGFNGGNQIGPGKPPSVHEYLVHSLVSATRKLLLAGTGTKYRLFVELNWDVVSVSQRDLLERNLNPQSNPQHAVSCAIFNDLSGPWQSPRSCKLL
jgi:hypothetical protein